MQADLASETTRNRPPESKQSEGGGVKEKRDHGLVIKSIQQDKWPSEFRNVPHVDVVHVMALCPEEDMLQLPSLLSSKVETERREIVFRIDMARLLVGELTQKSIEQQATHLLDGLVSMADKESGKKYRVQKSRARAIFFVAYDLAAVVVKMIFVGCPLRSLEPQAMEQKLIYLLHDKDQPWFRQITSASIHALVNCIRETNDMFMRSKIALRSRIISLYANNDASGKISPVFDRFTATLGLPSEIALEEQSKDSGQPRFKHLISHTSSRPEHWIPHPAWIPLEKMLLSLSPPWPSKLNPAIPSHASNILKSPTHVEWAETVACQALYVHGTSHHATHEAADQIFLAWQTKQLEQNKSSACICSFTFDKADPLRRSVPHMVASVLLRCLAGRRMGVKGDEYNILDDLILFSGGWSEKSCLAVFETLRSRITDATTLILLHDLDECEQESRKQFLDYYRGLSERTELPLRLLVTTRRPGSLLEELQGFPHINVDELALPDDCLRLSDVDDHLTRLCPTEDLGAALREHLGKLATMDKSSLQACLNLMQDHTGWPEYPSFESLAKFTELLSRLSPNDTPEKVLDRILRDSGNAERLTWMLSWLLCGYRPLSRRELTAILHEHCSSLRVCKPSVQPYDLTSPDTWKESWQWLERWLRVLADFSHGQVTVRGEIKDLLKDDTENDRYVWNEVRATAHQTIVEFCFAYLASNDTQERLKSIYQQHGARAEHDHRQLTAPLFPDGKDLLFYAVEALPYHLSNCPVHGSNALWSLIKDPTAWPSAVWAKVYWAMSNPFSRQPEPPESAVCVLAGLGMLSFEDMTDVSEKLREQCFVAAAGSRHSDMATRFLQTENASIQVLSKALTASIQADDETTALGIARRVISHAQRENTSMPIYFWPQSTIWAAVWLDMHRLVDTILKSGAKTDPQDEPNISLSASFFTSPLYMASRLGHAPTVRVLLDHGARTVLDRRNKYNCFFAAAREGHVEVLQEFLARDPSHLRSRAPTNVLYTAASFGNWKAVTMLLGHNMDPNDSLGTPINDHHEWTPLARACVFGYAKTTKVLLEYGADPNSKGPYDVDTPLWFATVERPSIQCIRYLLEHAADPNHELIKPPLLVELVKSRHNVDTVISICNVLITADPPLQLNKYYGETALMAASESGKLPLVNWLLDHGADVDFVDRDGLGALHRAIEGGQTAVVEAILQRRPKLDIMNTRTSEMLLEKALYQPEIVKLLLDAGADPDIENSSGETVISEAVSHRNGSEVVNMLLERKADIHHRNREGWTPICIAVGSARDAALVRVLADGGANLRDTVSGGRSLLHLAVDGPAEVLKILLEFGKSISLNHRDDAGQTPLLAARNSANLDCLKLLIKAGADVNAQGHRGETALHNAVWHNMSSFLSVLLSQSDIDVNRKSSLLGSPLHVACRTIRIESVFAILDHGADINMVVKNIFQSTPLIAALLPDTSTATRSQDATRIDHIVRTLVQRGANVQLVVCGSTFYTALSAACLGTGVSTLNFLLDEGASPQLADPVSGRLPLHFAAANGIENFRTILLSYRGDMMAADKEGKNCLHWAAQFGNTKTVNFILSRLDMKQSHYVGLADSDGWTPLCWATRPCKVGLAKDMRSEKMDYPGVVRSLLRHHADRAVTCRIGKPPVREAVTALELARRCDATEEVINLLRYGIDGRPESDSEGDDDTPVRRYNMWATICGVCLSPVFGIGYKCNSCPDFDVCNKCIARASTFHSGSTINDSQQHDFEIWKGREVEYQDSPLPRLQQAQIEEMRRTVTTNGDELLGEGTTTDLINTDFHLDPEEMRMDD